MEDQVFTSRPFSFHFKRPAIFAGYIGMFLLEHAYLISAMLQKSFYFSLGCRSDKISVLKIIPQS